MNEQQDEGRNEELYEQQKGLLNSPPSVKCQDLNNLIIYSGDTKGLCALLSHNPSPAITDLLQKNVMDKYGSGLKNDTEFVVDDETVTRYSNI